MFASSRYPIPAARQRVEVPVAVLELGEGRDCEASRAATAALLLPEGRAGAWLVLLAGSCVYVLLQALALGVA
jgi:hypothetical protein